eukprot:comp21183_c0_seq1/m.28745 comp21183_c0_seq1/g.28745  ORF comp21183_c0_seq1/g.28745 comp21183_c0_seq1/m.28745 type:complete len:311 (-) comp21183_c0_seq1:760-1692(-)
MSDTQAPQQPAQEQAPDVSFLSSVGQMPITTAAVEQATALYNWAKAQNEYIKYGLEQGEELTRKGAATITSTSLAQQVAPKLHTLDSAAGQKLEELKKSYPLINQPPETIFQATRVKLGGLAQVGEYARVATQTQELLKTQLAQNYEVAKTKTNDLVKTMQEQATTLVEYGKNLNLDQATADLKKTYESAQEYVGSALAGASEKAKTGATAVKSTIESYAPAIHTSQVIQPLQQQLESLKAQVEAAAEKLKGSLNPQHVAAAEALKAKLEDTLKAWVPVKDHLLAYVTSQQNQVAASPAPVQAAEAPKSS